MLLLQTIKSIILATSTFLIIFSLSFHIQVHAEGTDKKDKAHTLWEHGRNAFNERDYPTALEKFNESLTIYKETGDRQTEADLLTWLAATKIETDDFVKALNYLKESKEIYSKLHSKPGEKAHFKDVDKAMKVLVLYTKGKQYLKTKDYESAIKKIREALQLVREMGIKRYEVEFLLVIMRFEWEQYLDAKDYEPALKKLNEALRLVKQRELMRFENIIRLEIGGVYVQMGADQNELKNYTEAESYFQKALNIYRELNKKEDEGNTLVHIAALYFNKDENAKSLSYFKKALRIFEEIDNIEGHALVLGWIGGVYYKHGEFSKALGCFKTASEYFRDIGYPNKSIEYYKLAFKTIQKTENLPEEGSILYSIAKMYFNMGNYAEALNAYKKSLKIFKELNDVANQGSVLVGIGNVNIKLGSYIDAIDNLQEALRIFDGLEYSYFRELTLQALIDVHILLGNYEKANYYIIKSQKTEHTSQITKGEKWFVMFTQGASFEKVNKFSKALDLYYQALDLSKEIGYKRFEELSLASLGRIYSDLKEYPKALDFYKQALKLSRKQKDKVRELDALHGIALQYLLQQN